ncbi:MAG: M10 family metallopeptidase C-terminal domain-containing protein [Sulfitobacter sp.]
MANLDSGNSNINIDGNVTPFVDFGGTDTYTILNSLNANVTITDNNVSIINLPNGLDITAALFLSDGLQITVNGFTVTFLGNPALFTYKFGGTPLDANAGTALTFDETAAAFGTTVPTDGTQSTATTIGAINEDGTIGSGGGNDPTFALSANSSSISEGETVSFELSTTNVAAGTSVSYTVTGVSEADVVGALTGTAVIGPSGMAVISVQTIPDLLTEGVETLTVSLDGINESANVILNDTSTSIILPVAQEIVGFIANANEYGISFTDGTNPQDGVHTLLDSDSDNNAGTESHWEGEGLFNAPTSLTYGFVDNGGQMVPGSSVVTMDQGYLDSEKLFIRSVFDVFSNVSNMTFTEVSNVQSQGSADIRIGKGTADALEIAADTLGFAYQPNNPFIGPTSATNNPKETTQIPNSNTGDFFLVTDAITVGGQIPDWTQAEYNDVKNTISHELGHAVGLDHPFRSESGPSAGFAPITDANAPVSNYTGDLTGGGHQSALTDNMIETIMTYYSPSNTGAIRVGTTDIEGELVTNWKPGVFDIAALQHLYGSNTNFNSTDTIYTFNSNEIIYDTIWDAGGNDTLRVTGTGTNTIDLNDGQFSKVGVMGSRIYEITNTSLGIASDAVITAVSGDVNGNAIGLSSSIAIGGSSAFVSIDLPTLKGLQGDIQLDFNFSQGGVNGTQSVSIGDASSFFREGQTECNFGIAYGVIIENVETGDGTDTVVGNEAANNIFAAGGNNSLTGMAGADTFTFKSSTTASSNTIITDFTRGSDKLLFEGDLVFSTNEAVDSNWFLAWDSGQHSVTLNGLGTFDLANDAMLLPNPVASLVSNDAADYWMV